MMQLLKKEMTLAASPLSYLFIAFALLTFLPGYPILVGTFFVCLGLFQSFQCAREANDILYTALLPVAKRDIVRGKYLFCFVIEGCYFILAAAAVAVRMTVLSEAAVYRENALMNANLVYLGLVLLILGLFNWLFVGGFFKTAYSFSKPFLSFIVAAFLVVIVGETLFHIPHLSALNAFGFAHIGLQVSLLAAGILAFVLLSCTSLRHSMKHFTQIDL